MTMGKTCQVNVMVRMQLKNKHSLLLFYILVVATRLISVLMMPLNVFLTQSPILYPCGGHSLNLCANDATECVPDAITYFISLWWPLA